MFGLEDKRRHPRRVWNKLRQSEVETILAHELAHHRRGDIWSNWLRTVIEVTWWFNPLVWALGRTLRKISEDRCDDLVVCKHVAAGRTYCQALLNVARKLARAGKLGRAMGFAEPLHPLAKRLKRIMDPKIDRSPRCSLGVASLLLVLAALVLPGLHSESAAMGEGLFLASPADAPVDSGAARPEDDTSSASPSLVTAAVAVNPPIPKPKEGDSGIVREGDFAFSSAGFYRRPRQHNPTHHIPISAYHLSGSLVPPSQQALGRSGLVSFDRDMPPRPLPVYNLGLPLQIVPPPTAYSEFVFRPNDSVYAQSYRSKRLLFSDITREAKFGAGSAGTPLPDRSDVLVYLELDIPDELPIFEEKLRDPLRLFGMLEFPSDLPVEKDILLLPEPFDRFELTLPNLDIHGTPGALQGSDGDFALLVPDDAIPYRQGDSLPFDVPAVPEPATLSLLLVGGLVALLRRRR